MLLFLTWNMFIIIFFSIKILWTVNLQASHKRLLFYSVNMEHLLCVLCVRQRRYKDEQDSPYPPESTVKREKDWEANYCIICKTLWSRYGQALNYSTALCCRNRKMKELLKYWQPWQPSKIQISTLFSHYFSPFTSPMSWPVRITSTF